MIGSLQNRPPIETKDPVELSSRVIDTGELTESFNRVTQTLREMTHRHCRERRRPPKVPGTFGG